MDSEVDRWDVGVRQKAGSVWAVGWVVYALSLRHWRPLREGGEEWEGGAEEQKEGRRNRLRREVEEFRLTKVEL